MMKSAHSSHSYYVRVAASNLRTNGLYFITRVNIKSLDTT
jgi:hypothetical protein